MKMPEAARPGLAAGAALALALLCGAGPAEVRAQSHQTEHTYRLDDPAFRPPATLADVNWLVGSWLGEGLGGTFEEVWNPPSAGSMVGFFKLLDGDRVNFYELLLLVEEEGSLGLKVKHFSPEFVAWEEKPDYVHFRLVSVDDDAVHFSGISFYRIGENLIHGYIAMRRGEEMREEKLVYRRRDEDGV